MLVQYTYQVCINNPTVLRVPALLVIKIAWLFQDFPAHICWIHRNHQCQWRVKQWWHKHLGLCYILVLCPHHCVCHLHHCLAYSRTLQDLASKFPGLSQCKKFSIENSKTFQDPRSIFQDSVISQQCLNIATNSSCYSMIAALHGSEVCGCTHLLNSQKPSMSVKSEDTDGISKHRLILYFGAVSAPLHLQSASLPSKF